MSISSFSNLFWSKYNKLPTWVFPKLGILVACWSLWNSFDEFSNQHDLNPDVWSENGIDALISEQPAIQAGRFEVTHFANDAEYESAILKALWYTKFKTWYSHRAAMQHKALCHILNKQRLLRFAGLVRKQPFGIILHGPPGCGKSKAAYQLAKELKKLEGDALDASQLIVLNESDEYQSEYRSSHKVVVFDDVASSKLSVEVKDPYRKVIDFINNIPRCALNPHLELKGNVMIRPDIVILTTNSLSSVPQTQVEAGAFARRFGLTLTMPSRDNFIACSIGANFSADNKKSISVVQSNDKLGESNFSWTISPNTDTMNMNQLIDYAGPLYLDHLQSQQNYMESCILPDPPVEVRSGLQRVIESAFGSIESRYPSNRVAKRLAILKAKILGTEAVAQSSGDHLIDEPNSLFWIISGLMNEMVLTIYFMYFSQYSYVAFGLFFMLYSIVKNIVLAQFPALYSRGHTGIVAQSGSEVVISKSDEPYNRLVSASSSLILENTAKRDFYDWIIENTHLYKDSSIVMDWDGESFSEAQSVARKLAFKANFYEQDGCLKVGNQSVGTDKYSGYNSLMSASFIRELYLQALLDPIRDDLNIIFSPHFKNEEDKATNELIKLMSIHKPNARLVAREYYLYKCNDLKGDLLFYDFLSSTFYVVEIKVNGKLSIVHEQSVKMGNSLCSRIKSLNQKFFVMSFAVMYKNNSWSSSPGIGCDMGMKQFLQKHLAVDASC